MGQRVRYKMTLRAEAQPAVIAEIRQVRSPLPPRAPTLRYPRPHPFSSIPPKGFASL